MPRTRNGCWSYLVWSLKPLINLKSIYANVRPFAQPVHRRNNHNNHNIVWKMLEISRSFSDALALQSKERRNTMGHGPGIINPTGSHGWSRLAVVKNLMPLLSCPTHHTTENCVPPWDQTKNAGLAQDEKHKGQT